MRGAAEQGPSTLSPGQPLAHDHGLERSIEATTIISASADRVRGLLASDPAAALTNPTTLAAGGLHHDVVVTLDEPELGAGGVSVPVSWHPVDHARLFPSFIGELEAEPSVAGTRLRIFGIYSVPLGVVGQFGDGLVGRRLAQQSLQSLLEGVAARVAAALDAEDAAAPVTVVEQPSELFIG